MARIQGQRIRDEHITPGVIIVYALRPDQRPRHPEKEWRGKVLHYDRVFQRATVESLEAGYEGCEEDVWLEQIVMIEKVGYRTIFLGKATYPCFLSVHVVLSFL